jgi:four helix bundle protein
MGAFRDLRVWHQAHRLALSIYTITEGFPRSETYGLTSQLRRASVSVPANIAEGCGRGSDAELVRYLRIALGSVNELDYELLLAYDLHYVNNVDYHRITAHVGTVRNMLANLVTSLHMRRHLTEDRRPKTEDRRGS